ncbi:steroid 17-alpha-hydroxylase/17,20 lyase-like [Acanthaster planci]|uniref:Steroid 17-alpha-hydroxylase/17,20 lyase-like n=1 Tax=Acanthaster planci TaxID=133434 RepID=A0A8B7ZGM7_ACAPL|nr:steroid 17-alpha-hydroxylase/17,20 lyase-like [Acanthaster planci]
MLSMIGAVISGTGLLSSVPSLLLVGLAIGVAIVGILGINRPAGFPPGPTPIPFVGNIPKSGQPLWITVGELSKEYGDVFSLKLGDKWYVILNSYETIKDGMAARPLALANRPHYYTTDIFSDNYRDIAYTDYSPSWVLHRQFALNAFSDVYGATQLDRVAHQQFTRYVEPLLESVRGTKQSVDGIALGQLMAMGSVVTWCFGPCNEHLHRDLVKVVSVDVSTYLVGQRIPVDIFPILRYFPLSTNRIVKDVGDRFLTILRDEFNSRRQSFKEDEEITDLCGALLRAQKKAEQERKYDFLTDVHVVQVLASSFRGSTGLLANTYWGLALLAEYPDVQQRIVNEIHDVIGRDRQPSLNDRDAMPYTIATAMEMLRFGSVAPLGVPRAAYEDVTIGGYGIPKGTGILYNIYGTHFSDVNFANPDEFNPERFLNSSGSVNVSPDKLIPFGMGTRKCLGYFFAQSILFLAFTHLLQGYELSKLDGQPGDGSLLGQDPQYQGSRWPSPFRLGVAKRE